MGRIISGDPTVKELQQPPESSHEANVQFYTPSARYREVADFIDKDLVLSNLTHRERREVILIIRILLNSIKLEDSKGWKEKNGEANREISNYWFRRLVATATTTRALGGFTAKLSRTHISDETLKHDQTIKQGTNNRNPLNFIKGG